MEQPARDSSELFFGADPYSVDGEETPASSDSWSSGVHTPTSSDDDPAQPGGAPVQQHMPADESPYLEYEYPDPFETTSAWRTADSNSEAASSTLASSRDWVGDQEHREAQGADVHDIIFHVLVRTPERLFSREVSTNAWHQHQLDLRIAPTLSSYDRESQKLLSEFYVDGGFQNVTDSLLLIQPVGLCSVIREAGFSAKILERGDDFGGVWHFNRYPGARVDSDTPAYQFSLSKVWADFHFTERFPGHEEIRKYFHHVDATLDLRKDTIFDARVDEVKYDPESRRWRFRTSKGLSAASKYAVFACGSMNKPYIPPFPNQSAFGGQIIHPSEWPSGLELAGKRIGIVGQGASGLQIVQELAQLECKLTVFVRNPCIAVPMHQRQLSHRESEEMKHYYDAIFAQAKFKSSSALPYNQNPEHLSRKPEAERDRLFEQLWNRGGLGLTQSNYRDIALDKTANACLYDFWVRKTRSRMTDPKKMDIVAPMEQFEWFGSTRVNLEMNYYEALDQPNVQIVDLKKTPIKAFDGQGVLTGRANAATHHELDVVIMATGYDCVTGSLLDMNIHDKNGVRLSEAWKNGISTYLGMMIPNMPNAFMLYGPQGPTTQTNAPPFIELQVDWVVSLLERMHEENLYSVEPANESCRSWKDLVMDAFKSTIFCESTAWWTGANIPHKKIEPLVFLGGVQQWRELCSRSLDDWANFVVSKTEE
ncbi:Baeyer-Villiger monooxygenase [Colletotrichum fructicola]|nr:Baeyer-Villiger monooxygenase [Colletotrichum fructicola]